MNEVYAFIEAEKTTHGVALLCRLLKVARSSFYAWRAGERARTARKAADDASRTRSRCCTSHRGTPTASRGSMPGCAGSDTGSTASASHGSCASGASPASPAAGAGA